MLAKFTWQRVLFYVCLMGILGLAANTGSLIYARYKTKTDVRSGGLIPNKRLGGPIPYTVVRKETVYGPSGNSAEAVVVTEAIRSDGAKVFKYEHLSGNKTSNRIVEDASGLEVIINDPVGVKSTTQRQSVIPASWQRDPNSKCINSFTGARMNPQPEVINAEEMIGGYKTVKITANNVTSWYAIDYGCAKLKSRTDWGDKSFSEFTLVSLTSGEPAKELFDIPSQARELPPSERIKSAYKDSDKRSANCGEGCLERFRRLDEFYYANRPTK